MGPALGPILAAIWLTERNPLMLADCRRIPDDWHDCLLALRALGVEISEEAAQVAHLVSWYQQNKDIAKRMGLKVPKIKVLVHDVLILVGVEDRDAAAIVIRNAVEMWRTAPARPSRYPAQARPPKPRRPRADPGIDRQDLRRPAPSS